MATPYHKPTFDVVYQILLIMQGEDSKSEKSGIKLQNVQYT